MRVIQALSLWYYSLSLNLTELEITCKMWCLMLSEQHNFKQTKNHSGNIFIGIKEY
jgi:hypothetical protein